MQRPIIIVDPMSSGSELASTFKAKHVSSVAVSSKPPSRMGFGQELI